MTDERNNPLTFLSVREHTQTGGAGKADSIAPEKYSWPTLIKEDGGDLPAFHAQTGKFNYQRHVRERLGNLKGLLGPTFNSLREVMV
jgi:hypothetical protein